MAKLFFNTRDELTVVDSEEIAVIQANGNYSKILTIYRKEIMLSSGISKVEQALKSIKEKKSKFCQSWKKFDSESLFLAEDRSVEAADAAILQGKRNKNQRVQEDP